VFRGLPEWLREGRQNPTISKKRRQSSSTGPAPQQARSFPDISVTAREPAQPGLQRRSSTFPKQDSGLPLARTPVFDQKHGYATLAQPNGTGGDPFTPTTSNFNQGGFGTSSVDDSGSTGLFPYAFGADFTQPNLPDLSAMMFPSAEPFTYPNQPLTTFENNQFTKDQDTFHNFNTSNGPPMVHPRQLNTSDSDNFEAQFYALPPYMMQPQVQQAHNQQQRQMRQPQGWEISMQPSANGARQVSGQINMDSGMLSGRETWGGQQQALTQASGFSGVNLNEIFGGEEWNGLLMDQGYRH